MDVVQAMEQSSMPGRVHMSQEFADELRGGQLNELVSDEQADGTAFLAVPE